MTKVPGHISAEDFLAQLRRYQKGSISRRQFLGVTGLGLATAVLSSAVRACARARPMPAFQAR